MVSRKYINTNYTLPNLFVCLEQTDICTQLQAVHVVMYLSYKRVMLYKFVYIPWGNSYLSKTKINA